MLCAARLRQGREDERGASISNTTQATTDDAGPGAAGRGPWDRIDRRQIGVAAVVGVAVVVGLVLWLVLRGGGGSEASGPPTPSGSNPLPITADGLRTIAALGIPIYWVGEKPGTSLELTKTDDDRIYIRYLLDGVPIGSDTPQLTVATYPVKNAYAVTAQAAAKSDATQVGLGANAIAFYRTDAPTNVYLAYRNSDYQIEVYDPSPGRARALVASGQVEAVGSS